jgi:hypothetical protein
MPIATDSVQVPIADPVLPEKKGVSMMPPDKNHGASMAGAAHFTLSVLQSLPEQVMPTST